MIMGVKRVEFVIVEYKRTNFYYEKLSDILIEIVFVRDKILQLDGLWTVESLPSSFHNC